MHPLLSVEQVAINRARHKKIYSLYILRRACSNNPPPRRWERFPPAYVPQINNYIEKVQSPSIPDTSSPQVVSQCVSDPVSPIIVPPVVASPITSPVSLMDEFHPHSPKKIANQNVSLANNRIPHSSPQIVSPYVSEPVSSIIVPHVVAAPITSSVSFVNEFHPHSPKNISNLNVSLANNPTVNTILNKLMPWQKSKPCQSINIPVASHVKVSAISRPKIPVIPSHVKVPVISRAKVPAVTSSVKVPIISPVKVPDVTSPVISPVKVPDVTSPVISPVKVLTVPPSVKAPVVTAHVSKFNSKCKVRPSARPNQKPSSVISPAVNVPIVSPIVNVQSISSPDMNVSSVVNVPVVSSSSVHVSSVLNVPVISSPDMNVSSIVNVPVTSPRVNVPLKAKPIQRPIPVLPIHSPTPKPLPKPLPLPSVKSFSLRNRIHNVYDQGQLGSCTSNALCQAYRTVSGGSFQPSRLYLYYKERLIEKTVNVDSGADPQDGLLWLRDHGVCSEADWPYDITKFTVAPPALCDKDALPHRIINIDVLDQPLNANYATNLTTVIQNTLLNGYPVVIGIEVYQSFQSPLVASTGNIPLPNPSTRLENPLDPKDPFLGGHEVMLTGFDPTGFEFVNSWGTGWGKQGFGHLPTAYVTNPTLTQEFRYFTKTT